MGFAHAGRVDIARKARAAHKPRLTLKAWRGVIVLAAMVRQGEPVTIGMLGDATATDLTTIWATLRDLEQRGLVTCFAADIIPNSRENTSWRHQLWKAADGALHQR